jgi:hypothetical protein
MLLVNMDVLDLSYKVKIFYNKVLEAVCKQQFGMQYPVYHIILIKDKDGC